MINTSVKTPKTYKPCQIPKDLYLLLEHEAIKQRKKTGNNITWNKVLRKIISDFFQK